MLQQADGGTIFILLPVHHSLYPAHLHLSVTYRVSAVTLELWVRWRIAAQWQCSELATKKTEPGGKYQIPDKHSMLDYYIDQACLNINTKVTVINPITSTVTWVKISWHIRNIKYLKNCYKEYKGNLKLEKNCIIIMTNAADSVREGNNFLFRLLNLKVNNDSALMTCCFFFSWELIS